MTPPAHVIEIDEVVLSGATSCRPDRLRSLIQAEVQRVLAAAGLPAPADPAQSNVAATVARAVIQAVQTNAARTGE